MENSKSTKRAWLTSALSVLACVAMLIGTTFAWFTDTAKTNVNKIQSGTLDVALEMLTKNEAGEDVWVNAENQTLDFKKAAGGESEKILWEPGCTYELPKLRVVNNGNLALKYKVQITGIKGDAELNKVIDWTIGDVALGAEQHLQPEASNEFTIKGHMQETAGNTYQNKSIDGIAITVVATQDTVEHDSISNDYDKDAEYATPVSTAAELTAAVNAGKNVVLKNDLSLTAALNITKDISIDLNGKTVTSTRNFASVDGGKLTLVGGVVHSNRYVFNVNGGEVVVNDGEFVAQECVFALFGGSKLTVNGGTFTAKDNAVVATNGSSAAGCEITINGGVFNGNIQSAGYIACGVYVANKDTVNINGGTFNITDGVGVLMRAGNTTIGKDVVINLTNTGKVAAGKVGDANIDITTPSHLVMDVRSGYPGATAGFTITNNSAYDIVEYK